MKLTISREVGKIHMSMLKNFVMTYYLAMLVDSITFPFRHY